MRFSVLAALIAAPALAGASSLADSLPPTRTVPVAKSLLQGRALNPLKIDLDPTTLSHGAPPVARALLPNSVHQLEGRALNPVEIDLSPLALSPSVPMTNAQRLARGLSPNRPRFHRAARGLAPRASPTSDPCTSTTGTLAVAGTGLPTPAFVSRVPNSYGEYGITSDAGSALLVQYTSCGAATSGPVDLVTLNGIADFDYLGAITGFSSPSGILAAGSSDYAYVGGTTQTAPGAPPQAGSNSFSFASNEPEDIESTIWLLNSATGALTPQWVNPDGSTPATSIVYNTPGEVLVFVGDPAAFAAAFGASPVVTLTFVES